jgi:hypothetical protein
MNKPRWPKEWDRDLMRGEIIIYYWIEKIDLKGGLGKYLID